MQGGFVPWLQQFLLPSDSLAPKGEVSGHQGVNSKKQPKEKTRFQFQNCESSLVSDLLPKQPYLGDKTLLNTGEGMHVTITYIHRIYILKHSLQLLVMGPALSFSLFQELTPVAYQQRSAVPVNCGSWEKIKSLSFSAGYHDFFQIGETSPHYRGTTNYLFKLPGGLVESEGT